MGATVIAAASTGEKLQVCRNAGADHLLNYTEEDLKDRIKSLTEGRGADIVYDPVGGDYSEAALRAMAPGGRHLVIGFAAGRIPQIPLNLTLLKQCQIVGVFWGVWAMANKAAQAKNMEELFTLFTQGQLKPQVSDIFPFENYVEAYQCLMQRRAKGKVILAIGN